MIAGSMLLAAAASHAAAATADPLVAAIGQRVIGQRVIGQRVIGLNLPTRHIVRLGFLISTAQISA